MGIRWEIQYRTMSRSLLELGPVIFGPTEDLVAWFRTNRLLARTQDCSACHVQMREGRRSDVTGCIEMAKGVCSTKLLQSPTILGGPGVVVQIDESLFRHKIKVGTHIYNTYMLVRPYYIFMYN